MGYHSLLRDVLERVQKVEKLIRNKVMTEIQDYNFFFFKIIYSGNHTNLVNFSQ